MKSASLSDMYARVVTVLQSAGGWVLDQASPVTVPFAILSALVCFSLFGPRTGWGIRWPFFLLNRLQWILYNPLRWLFRKTDKQWTHGFFLLLLCSSAIPVYWLTVHILLTPLRLVNAIYFDMILFWTLTISDGLKEVLNPKLGKLRAMHGLKYLGHWVKGFPFRVGHFLRRNVLMLLEGIVMTGFDALWPTLTMWHGTSFQGTATDIAQKGRWYVGDRDHVGSGVYFGIERRIAEHYSGKATEDADKALVVSRVTLSLCRTTWTLPQSKRSLIGSRGEELSARLRWPWRTTEHWRGGTGLNWFEYCLVQPNRTGRYVRTWRARPIAVLKGGKVSRIWGGLSLWTGGAGGSFLILSTWSLIIFSCWCLYPMAARIIEAISGVLPN